MWSDYLTFLDYLELRRRVENRLSRPKWFMRHTVAFVLIAAWLGIMGVIVNNNTTEIRSYFLMPNAGHIMAIWSVLLLLHGVWAYWRSGARVEARGQAIEREMRERLQQSDSYLSDDPRDLFRLHGILQEDIRKRSSTVAIFMAFALINAMIWLPWAAAAAYSSFAWIAAPLLALCALPLLALDSVRHSRHEAWLQRQMPGMSEKSAESMKRKRNMRDAEARLSADDADEWYDFEAGQAKQGRVS